MATERNFSQRAADARRPSNAPYAIIGFLCVIILLGVGLLHYRPDLILTSAPAADAPRPTLSAPAIRQAQQAAPASAAEQQSLQQAIPTPDVSQPPPLPVEATAQAVQSTLDQAPASSLSPVDLTYRPLPTPTTMLTQEQFDASQASEEVNQLNTMLSGLTPAQQMVQVHEAEQVAQP